MDQSSYEVKSIKPKRRNIPHPRARIRENEAQNWLLANAYINRRVKTVKKNHNEMESYKMATLYKTWSANVSAPLNALICRVMDLDHSDTLRSKDKLYEAFLKYSSQPYAVLSLQPVEDYDPYAVSRDSSSCIHHRKLKDPLHLAERERRLEKCMLDPDWPIFPSRKTSEYANSRFGPSANSASSTISKT